MSRRHRSADVGLGRVPLILQSAKIMIIKLTNKDTTILFGVSLDESLAQKALIEAALTRLNHYPVSCLKESYSAED